MPTLEITIKLPEGTSVAIAGLEGARIDAPASNDRDDHIERYWRDYLSENGRRVYDAAARIEDVHGPGFTMEDIAEVESISYESVRSMHRTSGRSARKWREDTGLQEPVRLEPVAYEWDEGHSGMRTSYRLPPGVAEAIRSLDR